VTELTEHNPYNRLIDKSWFKFL